MKIKHFIILIPMVAILLLGTTAQAGSNASKLLPVYVKAQKKAIGEILYCFKDGANRGRWSTALQDLVRAEMGMISYGVSYRSDKLYGHLAEALSPTQYQLFGWRLFKTRLKNAGYKFTPPEDVFAGKHKMYLRKASCLPVEITFNTPRTR